MTKARNLSLLSTVEVGATTDQTKADLNAIGVSGGRKNIIINGGFDVWQRGTSVSSYNAYASADRWKHGTYGVIAKVSDGDRNTVLKMTTSTTNPYNKIKHYVESPARFKGKTLTLSFWMKTSEPLTNYVDFWISDLAGNYPLYGKTGGSAGNSTALSVSTTTSWAKYSVSVVIPSYTEKTDGTDKLEINLGLTNSAATGKFVYIDDVQLELGSVATDFEHRSYGEELALCQRYYQKYGGVNDWSVGTSANYNGVNNYLGFPFIREMRAAPTGSWTNNTGWTVLNGGAALSSTNVVMGGITTNRAEMYFATSAMTTGNASWVRGSSSMYIYLNAEL